MLHKISFVLVIIGGLNWLLEAFGFGIGQYLPATVAQIIYVLVGLSAIVLIFSHKKDCKMCEAKGMPMQGQM